MEKNLYELEKERVQLKRQKELLVLVGSLMAAFAAYKGIKKIGGNKVEDIELDEPKVLIK